MNKEITQDKLERYFKITQDAFKIVKESIIPGKEEYAKEIIEMVGNYISDAQHFEEKGEWVLAFGALNYAHGWIDSGVRLDVFQVDDRDLFTVK
ncbi:MAG: DUF357 domain-containing protein [Nanoarchaeota archaeon]|nr:DUF357 domain-containing protein [Nanoarchaeota archaeon]